MAVAVGLKGAAKGSSNLGVPEEAKSLWGGDGGSSHVPWVVDRDIRMWAVLTHLSYFPEMKYTEI